MIRTGDSIVLSRRSFLTGAAALAIAPCISGAKAKLTVLEIVNHGLENIRRTEDFAFLEGLSQRLAQTMIYGNPDWAPTQFTGLQSFYPLNADPDDLTECDGASDAPSSVWRLLWDGQADTRQIAPR